MKDSAVPTRHDEAIDLRELVARLWSGKWWIAASTLIVTVVFALIAFLSTPVYRASTILVPVGPDGIASSMGRGGLESLAGVASMIGLGTGGAGSNTDEALAVLKSRGFIYRFIDENELMPLLFADSWDSGAKAWREPDKAPTQETAYKVFANDVLSVEEDTRSGLVTLSVDWHDREVAAAWANQLVEQVNAEMRSRALRESEASLRYLQDELKVTNQVGIQEAISRLIEGQIQKRMLANVTKEYSFRAADRAMPPDEWDELRPRKVLLLALGLALGVMLGAVGVLAASANGGRR